MSQLGTELGGPAQLVVSHDPTVGQTGQTTVQQVQRDPPRLLELDLGRNMAFLAAGLVVGPFLGQIELAVQRGVAGRRRVGQEDADLAVVDLAQPTAPLASDPARFGPLLGEPLGSMTTTPSGSASSSRTWTRSSVMTASSSHLPAPTKNWIGLRASPAAMAIGSLVLRSRPLSSPRMTRWRLPVLDAGEPGEIALEKAGQSVGQSANGFGGDGGVVQEGLGLGLLQERHNVSSVRRAYPPRRSEYRPRTSVSRKIGYSRTSH